MCKTDIHCSCRTCSPAAALRRTHSAKRQADVRLQSLSEPHPDMAGGAPCDEEREHVVSEQQRQARRLGGQPACRSAVMGRRVVVSRGVAQRGARHVRQGGHKLDQQVLRPQYRGVHEDRCVPMSTTHIPTAVIASTNCPVRTQHVGFLETISVLLVVHFRT